VHLLLLHTQDYLNFSQFASHPPSAAATTSRLLVRLQHIFEEGESVKYSTPVNINLDKLLNLQGWKVANITEMNLTGNRAKTDIKKLKWITSGTQQNSSPLVCNLLPFLHLLTALSLRLLRQKTNKKSLPCSTKRK